MEKIAFDQKPIALGVLNTLTYELVDELKAIPRTLPIVPRILESNMASLDRMYALYPDTPESLREKSVNLNKMGDIWLLLGNSENAFNAYQQALEIRRKLADDDPKNMTAQRDLMVSLYKMGMIQERLKTN